MKERPSPPPHPQIECTLLSHFFNLPISTSYNASTRQILVKCSDKMIGGKYREKKVNFFINDSFGVAPVLDVGWFSVEYRDVMLD